MEPVKSSFSESLLVDDVVKSKQKEDRKKKDSSFCCRRPMLCITGRICGNTWTRLLSIWALLEIGIVGVNVPVLWHQWSSYARVVWSILGVLVLLFWWSWERTGVSSSVIDNPPPSNMKDHDLKKLRICSKCERWKPERCHHCKICGVCVLKMDHHCPWIGVCIGIKNYKAFCLFITYACVCQIAIAVTIFPGTLFFPSREEEVQITAIPIYGDELNIATTLMFILASLLSFPLMFFMHRHYRQIRSGKTTVETILDLPVFLEDQTGWERFQEIFGSSPWRWPFPLAEREPDGYSFKPLKEQSQSSKSLTESYKEVHPTAPTVTNIIVVDDERRGNTSINSTGKGKSRLMVDSSKYLALHKPIGSHNSKRSSHKSKRSISNQIIYRDNCIDSDEE